MIAAMVAYDMPPWRLPSEGDNPIGRLDPPRLVIFRSNHVSNAPPLAGTPPKDRDALLAALDAARAGAIPLRPAYLRGH